MRIKFLQKIIDIVRLKKQRKIWKSKIKIFIIEKRIEKKLHEIKQKDCIKIAFLHMYATSCQNLILFDKFLQDSRFKVVFILNPDISRGEEHAEIHYKKTKDFLIAKYGETKILDGYDFTKKQFKDYTKDFDIMTTSNPYDSMAHQFFQIAYWAKCGIPIFYVSYFYMGRCRITIQNLQMEQMNYIWKFFVENYFTLELAKQYQTIKGKNIVVSGYPKMDTFIEFENTATLNHKKTIIIAPHHALWADSNGAFLDFYESIFEVMKDFKDIDFIFRPHPFLFFMLQKDEYWGKEKTQQYFNLVLSLPNVTYSTQGEYLDEFAKCDALIHDCGSFMAEFLYTQKPCAFFYRKNIDVKNLFTEFGQKCLDCHTPIYNKEDLYNFVSMIASQAQEKSDKNIHFIQNEVMINYPHAADFIYEYLKQELQ